jgi:hypothetical protein
VSKHEDQSAYFAFLRRTPRRERRVADSTREVADALLGTRELALLESTSNEPAGYNPYDHKVTP